MNDAISGDSHLSATEAQRVLEAIRRYAIAVSFVGVAFLIRYRLTPILGEELPFMLFIAAALLAAAYSGAVAGISALLLGLFLADYFFVGRGPTAASGNVMTPLLVFRYIFTASLGIVLIEVQHRSRRRTERALEEVKREIALRKQSEQALIDAQGQLRDHAARLEHHVSERTAALRATVVSLQEVLYNIAHHLRAPLRAMSGFSEILLEQHASQLDDRGRELASNIAHAATRMDTLAHDLLEYGRLGHIEVVLEDIHLVDVVKAAATKLSRAREATNARITIDEPLPIVRGDHAILEKVLVELLDNAIKFAKPGTQPIVRIRAESNGERARLWIEDNGIGIEPRYHQRIFGVFERLHTQDARGTGIGLAIVKQGMHRLHGDAGVQSEPSHGSRFWVELEAAHHRRA